MRGTERVISPAPLTGALRGVPAEGVAGDSKAAPAQGKAFPRSSAKLDPCLHSETERPQLTGRQHGVRN